MQCLSNNTQFDTLATYSDIAFAKLKCNFNFYFIKYCLLKSTKTFTFLNTHYGDAELKIKS